ncbi:MAG: hypothetical protein JO108_30850 [Acidobacteriaceae bacterium]|nr:hypothetical protein [Acidobacteriaceae bacterium]
MPQTNLQAVAYGAEAVRLSLRWRVPENIHCEGGVTSVPHDPSASVRNGPVSEATGFPLRFAVNDWKGI